MRNWANRVYTSLRNYLLDIYGDDLDIHTEITHGLYKKDSVYLQLLINREDANGLENDKVNAQYYMFQIDTFTKDLDECYELMGHCFDAMKEMRFTMQFGIAQIANIDTNYKRLVARFHQIIGSSDEIKLIEKRKQ